MPPHRVCKPRRSLFEFLATIIGVSAGSLALLQNFNFLTVAEDNIIKTPTDPSIVILGLLVVFISIMFLNKTRK